MKIEKIKPRFITYKMNVDKDDEEYTSCMWARFILDYDTWRLTINSDAGDYTYQWGNNDKNDNFTNLMARVNSDYLLNKMSNRNKFFIDKSKANTIQKIEENGWDCFGINSKEEWEKIKQKINEIDDSSSEEYFFREVDSIVPQIDFECIEIVKDYPYGAYVAIDLFIKYIQPLLKEEWNSIKNQQN